MEDQTRSLLNCRWKKRQISFALSKLMNGIFLCISSGELQKTHRIMMSGAVKKVSLVHSLLYVQIFVF